MFIVYKVMVVVLEKSFLTALNNFKLVYIFLKNVNILQINNKQLMFFQKFIDRFHVPN